MSGTIDITDMTGESLAEGSAAVARVVKAVEPLRVTKGQAAAVSKAAGRLSNLLAGAESAMTTSEGDDISNPDGLERQWGEMATELPWKVESASEDLSTSFDALADTLATAAVPPPPESASRERLIRDEVRSIIQASEDDPTEVLVQLAAEEPGFGGVLGNSRWLAAETSDHPLVAERVAEQVRANALDGAYGEQQTTAAKALEALDLAGEGVQLMGIASSEVLGRAERGRQSAAEGMFDADDGSGSLQGSLPDPGDGPAEDGGGDD